MTAMPQVVEAILGATAMHWGLVPAAAPQDRDVDADEGDGADRAASPGWKRMPVDA